MLVKQLEKKAGVKDITKNLEAIRSFSVNEQRVGGGTLSPTSEGGASPRPFVSGQQTPMSEQQFPRFNVDSPSPLHSPKRDSGLMTPKTSHNYPR